MKAFLSHSSKDKNFVRLVAEQLGDAQVEYDEYTFEFTLNAAALRQALRRSSLFVLFLSENSLNSSFVGEEMRTALDFRAQGKIRNVLIFSIDGTSYNQLPEWLQSINVASVASSPLVCARAIQAELFALGVDQDASANIYIPRRTDDELRKVLSRAPGQAPIAVHLIGHYGIGRRTLLKRTIKELFPRHLSAFVEVDLESFEGPSEFYRRLYDHYVVSSITTKIEDFEKFDASDEHVKIEMICDLVEEAFAGGEFVLVHDKGGVYTDEGCYAPFVEGLVSHFAGRRRPVIGFAQQRMMPFRLRDQGAAKHSYHIQMQNFEDNEISELMSLSLREEDITFNERQLSELCSLLDGHPLNAKLAIAAIRNYGLEAFLADPRYLITLKRKRAEEFLKAVDFSDVEADVMALLNDYRYLQFPTICDCLSCSREEVAEALVRLEEFCCLERRGSLYTVSAAIRDAVGRERRFERSPSWRQNNAQIIAGTLEQYKTDDHITVSVLDAAIVASIRSGKLNTPAAMLILPSHFISLARDAYYDDRYPQSLLFAKNAFEMRNRLSIDGQIEALRLWGLSAIRLSDVAELGGALSLLDAYQGNKLANRNKCFLEGFHLRLKRRFPEAERKFLEAHKLAPHNSSINRELANLYRHQREFAEAEAYARQAYSLTQTNPYIIDILLETLLGKLDSGLPVDAGEIEFLFGELQEYGDVPGSSFYQVRKAQELLSQKQYRPAHDAATKAIARTPAFLPAYFLRAEACLALNDVNGARKDLSKIEDLLAKKGGGTEGEEGRAVELDILSLIGEKKFQVAHTRLSSIFLSERAKRRLQYKLARAVQSYPSGVDQRTLDWANKFNKDGKA